jgi:hypothetical protein
MAARKFFYVCAGLFLLALSFHLGSVSASAQQGTYFTMLDQDFARVGETVYKLDSQASVWVQLPTAEYTLPPDVNGGSLVTFNASRAVAVDGRTWFRPQTNVPWTFVGYIPNGGPVATQRQSWGSLKARYAPRSAPTSQPPPDR